MFNQKPNNITPSLSLSYVTVKRIKAENGPWLAEVQLQQATDPAMNRNKTFQSIAVNISPEGRHNCTQFSR